MKKLLLLLLLVSPFFLNAQSRKERKAMEARMKAEQLIIDSLQLHTAMLGKATDDKNAKEYIANEFRSIGLSPAGTPNYLQSFIADEGKTIDTATKFILNDVPLQLKTDYFPLPYSANKSATGMPALDLKENGEPWFADVKDWVEIAGGNNTVLDSLIKKEVERVQAKGATALILYNSGSTPDNIAFNRLDSSPAVAIPVVYLTPGAFTKYCSDKSALLDIALNVAIGERTLWAHNAIGYLDNAAPTTVVIATRYAKENENTQVKNANAAALVELARILKNSGQKKNNYLFVAFAPGERQATGSSYWMQRSNFTTPINYMINLDNIGTYDAAQKLKLEGTGSSPAWSGIVSNLKGSNLLVDADTGVTIAGDHDVFLDKNIPVLYLHGAQQKGNATAVNYQGELQVLNYLQNIIETTDGMGKIAFSRPADSQAAPANRFTVSLGVIPDNGYSGKGFKIGGVSPRRLADKIGLQAGDILVQLGDYKINEMNSYMNALSKFKKGDTTTLKVLRQNDEKLFNVEF